jgi:hypothetical protein
MIVHPGRHAAHQQRRIAGLFRRAGALAPERAKPLAEIGLTPNRYFNGLVEREIIREVRSGQFYLDDEAFRAHRAAIHRWIFVVIVIVSALMLLGILLPQHR